MENDQMDFDQITRNTLAAKIRAKYENQIKPADAQLKELEEQINAIKTSFAKAKGEVLKLVETLAFLEEDFPEEMRTKFEFIEQLSAVSPKNMVAQPKAVAGEMPMTKKIIKAVGDGRLNTSEIATIVGGDPASVRVSVSRLVTAGTLLRDQSVFPPTYFLSETGKAFM